MLDPGRTLAAVSVSLALLGAGCGGGGDDVAGDGSSTTTTSQGSSTTSAPPSANESSSTSTTTTEEPVTEKPTVAADDMVAAVTAAGQAVGFSVLSETDIRCWVDETGGTIGIDETIALFVEGPRSIESVVALPSQFGLQTEDVSVMTDALDGCFGEEAFERGVADLERLDAPGESTVTITEPGTYAFFDETFGDDPGAPFVWFIELQAGGQSLLSLVGLRPFTYSTDTHSGRRTAAFSVTDPGEYTVNVSQTSPRAETGTLAFGRQPLVSLASQFTELLATAPTDNASRPGAGAGADTIEPSELAPLIVEAGQSQSQTVEAAEAACFAEDAGQLIDLDATMLLFSIPDPSEAAMVFLDLFTDDDAVTAAVGLEACLPGHDHYAAVSARLLESIG